MKKKAREMNPKEIKGRKKEQRGKKKGKEEKRSVEETTAGQLSDRF